MKISKITFLKNQFFMKEIEEYSGILFFGNGIHQFN